MTSGLAALIQRWRQDAETLRAYGVPQLADLNVRHADELTRALRDAEDELLSQEQAAEESGYSTRHLRNLEESGTLPNRGRPGAPRYRRGDLPRKPGKPTEEAGRSAALDVLARMRRA